MALVLIVDDNPVIRKFIYEILIKDFNVIEASNGKDAINIATLRKPDVMVLDVTMPGGPDGIKVLETIKSDPVLTRIKVIMVTGQDFFEISHCISKGAVDFFTKPFKPQHLIKSIRKALQEECVS